MKLKAMKLLFLCFLINSCSTDEELESINNTNDLKNLKTNILNERNYLNDNCAANNCFNQHKVAYNNFVYNKGGWRVNKHVRRVADVNGDGRADIVGFGNDAVFVSLGKSDGTFAPHKVAYNNFTYNKGGWRVEKHVRQVADVNGDGRADIVGFGNDAVFVSLGKSDGTFEAHKACYNNFVYNKGGWRVERHPREVADVNGDGKADIIGFGNDAVYVSTNK